MTKPDPVQDCFLRAAMAFAAKGSYGAALSLLDGADLNESADAWLLRGKIAAQRRVFPEAVRALSRSLEIDRASSGAKAALECVERLQRTSTLGLGLRRVGLFASLLAPLVLVGGGLVVAGAWLRSAGVERSADATHVDRENEVSHLTTVEPVASIRAVAPVEPPAPKRSAPDLDLDLPGVRLRADEGQTLMTFERGLFDSGQSFVRHAELEKLRAVGRALARLKGQVAVAVEGSTDDRPVRGIRYRDNVGLAIARAASVVEELRQASGLDARAISIQGGDGPSGLADEDSRAQARTAVVRVRWLP